MNATEISKKTSTIWVVSVATEKRREIVDMVNALPYVDNAAIYPGYKTQLGITISEAATQEDREEMEKLLRDAVAK